MNKLLSLCYADAKNIFRDKSLYGIAFLPFMIAGFARFVIPWIGLNYPWIMEYSEYLTMFVGMQGPLAMGMIAGFVLLDEKDEGVLEVLWIVPLSPWAFLVYRLLSATIASVLFCLMVFPIAGLMQFSLLQLGMVSLLYGLTAPIIALLTVTFANNKVEGLAAVKIISGFLYLPVVVFFFDQDFLHLTAIFPMYFTFQLVHSIAEGATSFLYFGGGILMHLSALAILGKRFIQTAVT